MSKPAEERRESGRMLFAGGYLPPAARIRPGRAVVVVDLSSGGALVEGPWRFRPLSRCDVHIHLAGRDVQLRARIMRCTVARLERLEPVRYRTALAFDKVVELPESWDALEGYRLPADAAESVTPGVVDTQGAAPNTLNAPWNTENRPFPRND
jgi:hypothetical protein